MKRIAVSIVLIFTFLPLYLYGIEWSDDNITEVSTSQEDGKTTSIFQDDAGNEFIIIETESVSIDTSAADRIIYLKDIFFSWESMTIDTITFYAIENAIEIAVIPKTFEIDGVDLIEFTPAGLFFIDKDKLRYDFRMMKGSVFMRIKGLYIDEREFIKKINNAIEDPNAYIRRNDPDYFLAKLEELENEIEELKYENHALKYSLASLANRSFFGKITPINRDVLNKVIEIKEEHPQWTEEEVETELRNLGISYGRKELFYIFAVYFKGFE